MRINQTSEGPDGANLCYPSPTFFFFFFSQLQHWSCAHLVKDILPSLPHWDTRDSGSLGHKCSRLILPIIIPELSAEPRPKPRPRPSVCRSPREHLGCHLSPKCLHLSWYMRLIQRFTKSSGQSLVQWWGMSTERSCFFLQSFSGAD